MTPRSSSLQRGFTLIEMMITLCIFLLLAGAVFGIFTATLQSVAILQDNQDRGDRIEALGAWLRQQMLDLPASGTVTSYHRDGMPFPVSGIIWGGGADFQALDLHLQPDGNYSLRLAAYQSSAPSSGLAIMGATGTAPLAQFRDEIVRDDGVIAWRLLVRDLKTADWRFRSFNETRWQDVVSGQKPAIAEFVFQPAGGPIITDDFWIPPTQAVNSTATMAPPVVSSNP